MPTIDEGNVAANEQINESNKFDAIAPRGASGQVIRHDGTSWVAYSLAGGGAFPVADIDFEVYDNVDVTKTLHLQLSGITTATTRVLTIPDASGTIALRSGDLGTPTVLLLTNATGLPTAGLLDDAVTYAKMQNVSATDKVLGRSTAGAGDVEEIACTAAGRALIDDADAAAQRTTLGLGTKATQNQSGDIVAHIVERIPPATSAAQEYVVAGASSPAENFAVLAFDQTGPEYMDYKCWLSPKYSGGGLTIKLKVGGASASNNIRFGAALYRIEDTDDLDTTSHTYDFNDSSDTAAPATIGKTITMTITFTDGSDMDSVAAGEFFILRIRRTAATSNMAADAYLYGISIRET